jgi:hypothetical protein
MDLEVGSGTQGRRMKEKEQGFEADNHREYSYKLEMVSAESFRSLKLDLYQMLDVEI